MAEVQVPVTKSKGSVSIDTDKIPGDVWDAVIIEGLKAFVNKGMSKITTKGLEGEELQKAQAAAQAKAEENAKAILDGTIKLPGRKAKSKAKGEVMTEARRLARNIIKDQAKAQGIKVSHIPSKELTAAVKMYLESDLGAACIKQAEENIKARQEAPKAEGINLAGLFSSFDTIVAKSEESTAKARERGKQLSAKQAGMTAKRKPKAQQATAH